MQTFRFPFALPILLLLPLFAVTANPAQPTPAPAADRQFEPVLLDAYYQRLFGSYRPTESWALVPRGLTNFDGVPFRMLGKIDLTGLGRARDGEFQPARVGEIPVGQRATRLHVVHGASYDAPDGTPIACLWLHYNDGDDRKLFIRYGVHARNWYVERSERIADLEDLRSLVVWRGNSRPDGLGTPTRLFKTTFDNPRPKDEIRAIDLLSLFARANSVILAITIERSAAPGDVPASPGDDDSDLRREMLVRVFDAGTSRAVSNVIANLKVAEDGRAYGFGNHRTDQHGQVLLDYPPGRFQELNWSFGAPGYLPLRLATNSADGIYPPELSVRLVNSPTSPPKP